MVPVLVLAIAFGFIRSLMWVVAHDEASGFESATADFAPAQSYDPTVPTAVRSRTDDDVRAFLLPAVPEPGAVDQPVIDRAYGESRVGSTDGAGQLG